MSDPDLTPADEQVRRLLADARLVEPLPDDVADRLDRVLAGLQDETRAAPAPVDLGAVRRRRIARNVLVAAAAVVVLGVGISRTDLGGQGDGDSAGAGSADSSAIESAPKSDSGDVSGDGALTRTTVVLRSETFDEQVRHLQAVPGLSALASSPGGASTDRSDSVPSGCDDPAWGPGERVPVRYDGQQGVLVLRPSTGPTRDVDLFLCGDSEVARSVTVPVG